VVRHRIEELTGQTLDALDIIHAAAHGSAR
jgi:hypothetical protein